MPRALLVRLLLSAVLVACFSLELYFDLADPPVGQLPFDIEQDGARYVLHAQPDVPLPSPLAEGQIVDLSKMGILDRVAVQPGHPIPVGTPATVVVEQQDKTLRATFVATPYEVPPQLLNGLQRALGVAILTFSLAVAILTLWRGRDGTAWGLCCFFSVVIIGNALGLTATPLAILWLQPLAALVWALALPGLYVMAECLAERGLARTGRTVARLAVAGGALALAVAGCAIYVRFCYLGAATAPWLKAGANAAVTVLAVIPVLTLVAGYRGANEAGRRRMRWVLLSTAVLVACFIVLTAAGISPARQPLPFAIFNGILPGLAFLGYLYAILSTRVVNVGFVVDRALVFSVTTGLMFGMFALLEDAVHELALGGELGWAVQALGAVAVAGALSPLHRLLDRGLERLFFHRLRALAGALRRLARESAFFEDEEALLSHAVRQLLLPCAAAAIYERKGAVYQLRVSDGDGWPHAVDRDDPVFVSLRAEHGVLELKGMGSAAGTDGLAFPMRVGQLLTGAVLVRLREGEQLDRDVRAALGELVHALGTSLYLLRYREQARLLADIAAGRVTHEAVRTQVAALPGAL